MNRIFESMNFTDFLLILRKHVRMILGITAALAILCYAYGKFFQAPKYRAGASVVINTIQVAGNLGTSGGNESEAQFAQMMLNTYCGVMTSDSVLDETSKSLNNEIDSSQLSKLLKISPVESSEMINVEITWKDPAAAQTAVKEILELSQDKMKAIYPGLKADVVTSPKVDPGSLSRSAKIYGLLGLFAGLILSVLLSFFLEVLSSRIRSEKDVRLLKLPLIGVIPELNAEGRQGDME